MQDEMPTEGQFVAVWEHNGKLWSDIHCYTDGQLMQYTESDDSWEPADFEQFYKETQAKFIVQE